MVAINLKTPAEMQQQIADAAKAKRLSLNLSQKTISDMSGVSYGVVKKFERTGRISLDSLLKLALSLDALNDFTNLFILDKPETALSLDDLIATQTRKRGRK